MTVEIGIYGTPLTDPCRECGRMLPEGYKMCPGCLRDDEVYDRWEQIFEAEHWDVAAREAAALLQCARVDVIEAWAREIDEDFAHRGADARGVIRRVEAAWGRSIPGEDDGPVALACYARDLFNAVAEHADDIAGSHDHDPRNARRYGWDCALIVPAALTASILEEV